MIKNKTMNTKSQILIGGAALQKLGNDRYTDDKDFLIFDDANNSAFITGKGIDFLNAGSKTFAGKFFNEIYQIEKGNEIASPQSLLELKAFAFVQHCQNFNFKKADSCEYDIKFLVRTFNLKSVKIVKNYITDGELSEVMKIINSVKF
jgi:hypothetical protein